MGWLLYTIALTGSLSVFNPEISHWMHPELKVEHPDPIIATVRALDWLQSHVPHARAWYLSVATTRLPCTIAIWNDGPNYLRRALDPVTGAPDTLRDTLGGAFFFRFHFDLQLPYPFGRLISGAAAMALVMILISGTVIHRRILSDMFTFRSGKGQRSWLDLHNLLGVAALPFHIVIALSGAITLATLLFPAISQAAFPGHPGELFTDLMPQASMAAPSGQAAPLAPFAPILTDATRRLGVEGLSEVYVYAPGDRAAVLVVISGNATHIGSATHMLRYDAASGALLSDYREQRGAVATYKFLYGLHVAHFAPPVERWVYFLSGLALACVIASGTILWIGRTRKRSAEHPRLTTDIIERINTGILFGSPLGFASFLLVDRALPWTIAQRAALEVRFSLLIWVGTVVLSVIFGTRLARRGLCAALVVALLVITALSAPWSNGATRGVAICSMGLAAAFFAALRRT